MPCKVARLRGLQVMCGNQYPMYMDLGRWLHVTKAGFLNFPASMAHTYAMNAFIPDRTNCTPIAITITPI